MYMDFIRRAKELNAMNKNNKHKGLLSSSPSPPRYARLPGNSCDGRVDGGDNKCGTRKGYVPVVVGGEGVRERFHVPTKLMCHPTIVALLKMSVDEFGYGQEGVLQIPCEPDCFREILKSLPLKKR